MPKKPKQQPRRQEAEGGTPFGALSEFFGVLDNAAGRVTAVLDAAFQDGPAAAIDDGTTIDTTAEPIEPDTLERLEKFLGAAPSGDDYRSIVFVRTAQETRCDLHECAPATRRRTTQGRGSTLTEAAERALAGLACRDKRR